MVKERFWLRVSILNPNLLNNIDKKKNYYF